MSRLHPLALVFALAWTDVARADEISPIEEVCRDKEVGAACEVDGQPGHCKKSSCSRIDYSSGKPTPSERPCNHCALDEPPAKAEVKAPEPVPAKTDAPVADAPAGTAPPASPAPAPAPAKKGCSVDAEPLSLASVALGLVLLVVAAPRRRR